MADSAALLQSLLGPYLARKTSPTPVHLLQIQAETAGAQPRSRQVLTPYVCGARAEADGHRARERQRRPPFRAALRAAKPRTRPPPRSPTAALPSAAPRNDASPPAGRSVPPHRERPYGRPPAASPPGPTSPPRPGSTAAAPAGSGRGSAGSRAQARGEPGRRAGLPLPAVPSLPPPGPWETGSGSDTAVPPDKPPTAASSSASASRARAASGPGKRGRRIRSRPGCGGGGHPARRRAALRRPPLSPTASPPLGGRYDAPRAAAPARAQSREAGRRGEEDPRARQVRRLGPPPFPVPLL